MAIEMGGTDSHGECAFHLGANFLFRLGRFGLRRDLFGGGIDSSVWL